MATLRPDQQRVDFAFSPEPEVSHFAAALHLGDRPPEQRIVRTRRIVRSIAMDAQYRVQVPLCAVES